MNNDQRDENIPLMKMEKNKGKFEYQRTISSINPFKSGRSLMSLLISRNFFPKRIERNHFCSRGSVYLEQNIQKTSQFS